MSYTNLAKTVFENQLAPSINERSLKTTELTQQNLPPIDLNQSSPGKLSVTSDTISKMNQDVIGNRQKTLLSFLFFSEENINNIQKILKNAVFREINYSISNQSNTEILKAMREVYITYANEPPIIDRSMTTDMKVEIYQQNMNQIHRLNTILINQVLPQVCREIISYIIYLDDISKVNYKNFNPVFTSSQGTQEYRSSTQALVGDNVL
jgi:hypothetical protein